MPAVGSAPIFDGDNETDKKYIAMTPKADAVINTAKYSKIDTTSYAISAVPEGKSVVYNHSRGGCVQRKGGTRAWRNNNPGCIRYSPWTRDMGAIGEAGGFAVFPDEETGRCAITELLKTNSYRNLTIARAVAKYAPPAENNTERYKRRLSQQTGLALNKRLRDLNSQQLERVADAIKDIEGWKAGEIITVAPDTITGAQMINLALSNQR